MQPENDDGYPDVAGPVVILGFALMVEATLLLIGCLLVLLFSPFALIGLFGSATLMWAGWLLAGLSVGNYRLASILTVIAGSGMAVFSLVLVALASCRSFVNCGSGPSDYSLFALPIALGLFNLLCAGILWRRTAKLSRPSGRKTGGHGQSIKDSVQG